VTPTHLTTGMFSPNLLPLKNLIFNQRALTPHVTLKLTTFHHSLKPHRRQTLRTLIGADLEKISPTGTFCPLC